MVVSKTTILNIAKTVFMTFGSSGDSIPNDIKIQIN